MATLHSRRNWPCWRTRLGVFATWAGKRRRVSRGGGAGWPTGTSTGTSTGTFDRAEADLQAQALCDLLDDPSSGITRVVVVGAPPPMVAAVVEVAGGRGVVATATPSTGAAARADGRVTLRPQHAGEST